jgi:hypothetical protein
VNAEVCVVNIRKKAIPVLVLTAAFLMLSACLNGDPASVTPEYIQTQPAGQISVPTIDIPFADTVEYPDVGIALSLPGHWLGQRSLSNPNAFIETSPERLEFGYMPNAALQLLDEARDSDEEESGELFALAWDMFIPLAVIIAERQNEEEAEERLWFSIEVPLGEQDGYILTFLYNDEYDDIMLDDSEKTLFADLIGELPLIPQNVTLLHRLTAATDAIVFSAVTLDDEPLNSSFFHGYEMTVIFVWATWQNELDLTALTTLQHNIPEGVGLLGVVADVTEKGLVWDNAKTAVTEAGTTFPVIANNSDLAAVIRDEIITYPAFMFADRRSLLIGNALPADLHDIESCLAVIAERLAETRT